MNQPRNGLASKPSKVPFRNMTIIDGNLVSETVLGAIALEVKALQGPPPAVAFIRVGNDPASVFYVGKKQKIAARLGIGSHLHALSETVSQDELFALIDQLNADPAINGILVQAPLPSHLCERATFNRVHPDKDVDGFNTINIGRLCQEDPEAFVACTPAGIIELLRHYAIPTAGAQVVVVGRSLIVGKPVALLLGSKGNPGDATVTVCHSRTRDLGAITRTADILIAAIGRPHCITGDMIKPGATVIDVGINRIDDASSSKGYRIVGDVDFEAAAHVAGRLTPVPGGVGPMTVAMLMSNTLKAYLRQHP
jgi:methylenetetrahydrofolate dehydrogenase (NADP+)/methenyltetrahydrofolate cyclohydrolase